MQPTFGVSFGLPQPSHGGYPINPFNSNPLYNPYGPALNSGGVNLGLVSVNPLLAVQVTKNDYGEKIVKPFVNLHVTPNEHVVNKISHLFHEKKLYLLNKHEHYHHYNPHHGHHYQGPIHPVHSHGPPGPSFYGHHGPPDPSFYGPHGPPVYSPQYNQYKPDYGHVHPYRNEPPTYNDEYYDDNDNGPANYDDGADYNNVYQGGFYGFERSANNTGVNRPDRPNMYASRHGYSRSLTLPPNNPGANRGGQTVRFPENRKKREITVEKSIESIEEVISRPILLFMTLQKIGRFANFYLLISASRIFRSSACSAMQTKSGVLP